MDWLKKFFGSLLGGGEKDLGQQVSTNVNPSLPASTPTNPNSLFGEEGGFDLQAFGTLQQLQAINENPYANQSSLNTSSKLGDLVNNLTNLQKQSQELKNKQYGNMLALLGKITEATTANIGNINFG